MILYTTMPVEQVFPEEQSVYDAQKTVPCQAGQLLVEQEPEGHYRIVRLLSSDPNAYLQPEYTPGTILRADHLI